MRAEGYFVFEGNRKWIDVAQVGVDWRVYAGALNKAGVLACAISAGAEVRAHSLVSGGAHETRPGLAVSIVNSYPFAPADQSIDTRLGNAEWFRLMVECNS